VLTDGVADEEGDGEEVLVVVVVAEVVVPVAITVATLPVAVEEEHTGLATRLVRLGQAWRAELSCEEWAL
jgi:hypothetical protein